MKKSTLYSFALGALFLLCFPFVQDVYAAVTPFTSSQVGTSPQNGYILSTNGSVSSWIANSGGGGGGSDTNWTFDSALGVVRTATTTNGARAAFFTATSTTEASTIAYRLGVGTTSPSELLEIGSGGADAKIKISASGGNTKELIFSRDGAFNEASIGTRADEDLYIENNRLNENIYLLTNGGAGAITRLTLLGNGNVGIGTTSPLTKLHIESTSAGAATAALILGNGSTDANTEVQLRFAPSASPSTRYSYISAVDISTGSNLQDLIFATAADSTPTEKMRILYNGNVGIGTSSPASTLVVSTTNSNGASFELTPATSAGGTRWIMSSTGTGSGTFGQGAFVLSNIGSGTSPFVIRSNNTGIGGAFSPASTLTVNGGASIGASYITTAAPSNGLIVQGNVGIGSTTPYAKLSVTNTTASPSFVVEDSTSPDATPFIIDARGNVGIGVAAPSYVLDVRHIETSGRGLFVQGSSLTSGYNVFSYSNSPSQSGTLNAFQQDNASATGRVMTVAQDGSGTAFLVDNNNTGISLDIDHDASSASRITGLWIDVQNAGAGGANAAVFVNGNVGIGSTTPSERLTVAGNAYIGGNLTATGTLSVTGLTTLTNASTTNITISSLASTSRLVATNATTTTLFSTTASSTSLFASVVNFGSNIISLAGSTITGLGTWDLSGAIVKQRVEKSFSYPSGSSNATTTTATTTLWLAPATQPQTYNSIWCTSSAARSVPIRIGDGTNWTNILLSTTTVSSTTLSSNNTFISGEARYAEIGAMTAGNIACSFDITVN